MSLHHLMHDCHGISDPEIFFNEASASFMDSLMAFCFFIPSYQVLTPISMCLGFLDMSCQLFSY